MKEYYIDNKATISAKMKEYRVENIDKIQQHNKEYRDSHKKDIQEYRDSHKDTINAKCICECGGKFTFQNMSRHLIAKQ